MSHWGARTGYGYEAQRVAFLRETYRSERRHREMSLSPRVDPSIEALARAMSISPAMPTTANRIFGSLPTTHVPASVMPHDIPAELPKRKWPAVSTQSQISFRAPDNDFLERFKAGKEYGKMHDKETDYREQVFSMWNITGIKEPAVFRP